MRGAWIPTAGFLLASLVSGAGAGGQPISERRDPARMLEQDIERVAEAGNHAFVFLPGGCGVIVSEDGYLLTNHHVAGAASEVCAVLADGRTSRGKRVCSDPLGDLTLFKLDPLPTGERYRFLKLGDSDKLEIGDFVVALGNPFLLGDTNPSGKFSPSVSSGVVSALWRRQGNYMCCIQTDAALNPGNSGGPLLNLDAEIVGINARIASRFQARVNSGAGFAIASRQIRKFLPLMMKGGEGGKVYHGEVGGMEVGLERGPGALVQTVMPESTAEKAGIRSGDWIVRLDEQPVLSRERWLALLAGYPAGEEVRLRIRRDKEERVITLKLDRRAGHGLTERPRGAGYLGVQVDDTEEGVVVADVAPDSPAEKKGVRMGDLVIRIDGIEVRQSQEFLSALWKKKPGETVILRIRRDDRDLDVEAVLGKHPAD